MNFAQQMIICGVEERSLKKGNTMKYPKLRGVCKDCLGCQRLENPNFVGVYKCKWNEKVEWKQERIKI